MNVQRFSSKELKSGHLRHLHLQYSHRFSSKQNHQKKVDTFYNVGCNLSIQCTVVKKGEINYSEIWLFQASLGYF